MARRHYRKDRKYNRRPKQTRRKPQNRVKRRRNWHVLEISLIAAIVSGILRYRLNLGYLTGVSAVFWTIFMLSLYLRVLKWINRLDMRNDLSLWTLRIAGSLMIGIGVFFGLFMIPFSVVFGDPFSIGISILISGLIIPGAFALFRSTRRYPVVYVGFLRD